jgi:hypothetical protein
MIDLKEIVGKNQYFTRHKSEESLTALKILWNLVRFGWLSYICLVEQMTNCYLTSIKMCGQYVDADQRPVRKTFGLLRFLRISKNVF